MAQRGPTLAGVADELYALPPQEFIAARDARSKELRAGDRDLADAVKALRRPAPVAWAVNLLARDADLRDVDRLGERLRAAQASADREALTALGRERRDLVRSLAARAGELADAAGRALAQGVLDEVAETLQSAMADPEAAAAVRSGRLLRGLEAVGFDPVDLDGAVAVPDGAATAPRPARRTGPRAVVDPEAELKRARADADAVVADARRAAGRAEAATRELGERAADVDRRREELATEVDDLETELRAARRGLAGAERELQRLDRDRGGAERRADQARAALARAEAARAKLG
ncbi:transposase [Pseudolysinimonas sp.]|uniref:transposase n=1 Tax=Pseudolysinimonas sp. TaxID=2680009 RepID=UPI003F7D6339